MVTSRGKSGFDSLGTRHYTIFHDGAAADTRGVPIAAIRLAPSLPRCARLCGSGTKRGNSAHILFAFGVPSIVSRLHADPDPGAVAKQLAESNRNRRGDRLALAQNVVEMLP